MLINTTSSPAPFSSPQGSLAEAAANHHSLVQGMFYEECDINDEDATFYIFTATTTPEPQRVGYNSSLPLSPSQYYTLEDAPVPGTVTLCIQQNSSYSILTRTGDRIRG